MRILASWSARGAGTECLAMRRWVVCGLSLCGPTSAAIARPPLVCASGAAPPPSAQGRAAASWAAGGGSSARGRGRTPVC